MNDGHDPACPDPATQQAVLNVARAVLGADPEAAHDAAAAAPCPACAAISAMQLAVALVCQFSGQPFVSELLRQRLLAAVAEAQAELDGAAN